jgi:hypothetical protein
MFEWHKKEAPFFTGIARGAGGFGFGRVDAGPSGPSFSATGGTKFTSGSLTYHVYSSTGPNPFTVSIGSKTGNIFIVAGGAGGNDGGAGAGGIREVTGYVLSTGEYVADVGTGGAGVPGPRPGSTPWPQGGNSNFYLSGASYPSPTYIRTSAGGVGGLWGGSGIAGGSGGGAGNRGTGSGGVGNTPPEPGQYGNPGGSSGGEPEADIGGGGGGAGGAGITGGTSAPTGTRGNGGPGQPFPTYAATIIGPAIPAPQRTAFINAVGPTGLYGGGGGGGGRYPGDNSGTIGGPGGGGSGGNGSSSTPAGTPGIFGTGGGGGGGGYNAPNARYGPGGAGGQGIIIITYPT